VLEMSRTLKELEGCYVLILNLCLFQMVISAVNKTVNKTVCSVNYIDIKHL